MLDKQWLGTKKSVNCVCWLQRASSQLTPSTSQVSTVSQPVIRVASPLSSVIVSQSSLASAALQPLCARIPQPAVSAATPLLWNTNTNAPVATGGFVVQVRYFTNLQLCCLLDFVQLILCSLIPFLITLHFLVIVKSALLYKCTVK